MSHTCKNCGVEHDSNFCPECGTPAHVPDPPDPPRHRGYGAVMVAIGVLIGFIVGIGACMVYGISLGLISFEGGLPAIVIQETIPASTPPSLDPATSSAAVSCLPSITSTPSTLGESNAASVAQLHLSTMAFSREGLIKQLEFEGFTTDEATHGVDACGADWDEQAVRKAKTYLGPMAFSYAGLIKQLEFDGFTSEQAQHGVDGCGADWNEQAARKAKTYLDTMSFSRAGLIKQLEFDGFTSEQAQYGASENGY